MRLVEVPLPRPGSRVMTIDLDGPVRYGGVDATGYAKDDPHSLLLVALLRILQPQIAVEIGTFDGDMTVCLASVLPPGGVLYGLDLNPEWAEPLVKAWSFDDKVQLMRGDSRDIIPILPDHIGFAYVDGDHSFNSVKSDTELLWPKIAPEGIVAFHDVNGVGIRDYLPGRFPHAIYFPCGQGVAIVQKGPKMLRYLGDTQTILWP